MAKKKKKKTGISVKKTTSIDAETKKKIKDVFKVLERENGGYLVRAHCLDPRIVVKSPLGFQRELKDRHVKDLGEDYDAQHSALIQAILYNGEWHVADGQHRIEADILWGAGKPLLIKVHNVNAVLGRPLRHPITRGDAKLAGSKVFRAQNLKPVQATSFEKFKNHMDCKDPIALLATKFLKAVGYRLTKNGTDKHSLSCPTELYNGAKNNPAELERAINIAAFLANGEPIPRNLIKAIVVIQVRGADRDDGKKEDPLSNAHMKRISKKFLYSEIVKLLKMANTDGTAQNTPATKFLNIINKDRKTAHFRLGRSRPINKKE
jgi:hypothetical protein